MKFVRALSLVTVFWAPALSAAEFKLESVERPSAVEPGRMEPGIVYFTDRRSEEDGKTGLVAFEAWDAREKKYLSLFPGYAEPTVSVMVNGVQKEHKEKLHVFVAEARFLVSKSAETLDLSKFATLGVIEKIDPAIKVKTIAEADVLAAKDKESVHNANPNRPWCAPQPNTICIQSRYDLEGKLPLGVRLANKLEEEGGKKISEYVEFQSEVRVVPPEELAAHADLTELTGLQSPVVGALEQNIFHVNHMLQFGKVFTVFQQHPTDSAKTIATAYIALGIETDVLEQKAAYQNVPVLRNLVPNQVLMGNSSFNTGESLSAGLPTYTRNQAKAIAALLDE